MDYEKMQKQTVRAFKNPKPGMRFHEMYSSWVYVLARPLGMVVVRTFSGHPANPVKETIKYETYATAEQFREHYAYSSIPGYSVDYCDDLAFEKMEKEEIVTQHELEQGYRDEV